MARTQSSPILYKEFNGWDIFRRFKGPVAEEEQEKGSRGVPEVIVEEVLGRKRWKKRVLDGFPPFLSTLDKGGRPGYDLVRDRRNRRLVIVAEDAEYNNSSTPMRLVRAGGPHGGVVKMGSYCDD